MLLFFIIGPGEELYWRGFIQNALSSKFGENKGAYTYLRDSVKEFMLKRKSIFYTFMGPFGVKMSGSTAILDTPTIQALQYLLIPLGTIGSIYTAYRLAKSNYGGNNKSLGTSIVYGVLRVILGIINIVLFMLPMAMRM